MNKCDNDECEMYPYYGVAPHQHELSNANYIGSTVLLPKDQWPKNYYPDPEVEGCGIYVCPDCYSPEEINK